MNRGFWSNPWFVIPALLFLNIGFALRLVVPYGDEILYFNTWRAEPLNSVFRFFTFMGEVPAFVAMALVGMVFRYRYALLIALAGLFIVPVSYFSKDKIGVDRPITYFEKEGLREAVITVPGVDLNGGQTSFPSGHTMAAFCMYALLAGMSGRAVPWLGLAFAWTAILVGISRIFLVQHFLT
ncbi:MAG: phosphatase PAP2 family protein, partial [Thermoanaerobaculia bacterium]|nr:phosphatase PAP2 family protein [Thermoanaerobaculia bacterium]